MVSINLSKTKCLSLCGVKIFKNMFTQEHGK
jgi:hypothetical protein